MQFFRGIQCKQVEHCQLGRITLCGCNRNFRACPGVNAPICKFCNGATDYIDNSQCLGTSALAFLHSCNGIRCFAGLRQNDQQCAAVDQGIGIPQLACQFHQHRNATQLLNSKFGRTAGIIGTAAGRDHDFSNAGQVNIRIVQYDFIPFDSGSQSRFDGTGLLHDLFEHKVLIATFFRSLDIPCNPGNLLLNRPPHAIVYLDKLRCQLREFSILQIDRISCIGDQCGYIGGKVHLSYTDA